MPQKLLTYQIKANIFLYQIMFMILPGDLEFRRYEFKTYFSTFVSSLLYISIAKRGYINNLDWD